MLICKEAISGPIKRFLSCKHIHIHWQHVGQSLVILVKMFKFLTALKRDLRAVLPYLVDKDEHYIWKYYLEIENYWYQQTSSE